MKSSVVNPLLWITAILLIPAYSLAGTESESIKAAPEPASFLEGVIIDSVIIDNRNIYDTDDKNYDKFIFKIANKLHIKTHKFAVSRELLLKKGDPFSTALAEESSRNLRQNLKVYDAWIEVEALPNGNALMRVVTIDEWSLTGGISYSREGNETKYKLGIEEENFLGSNQFISFYYSAQSDDDNFVETRFFNNRFLGKRYRLRLDFINDPLNTAARIALSRPYYDLRQKFAYGLDVRQFSGRRDIFRNNIKIAESMFNGDVATSTAAYRFGAYQEKLTLQLSHSYRFERNFDKKIFTDNSADSLLAMSSFALDSLYHEVRVRGDYSRFNYVKLHNIDGFKYTEDLILGYFASLEYSRAFVSDFTGHHFDIIGASVSRYFSRNSSLVFLDYGHQVWFKGSGVLRRFATLKGKYYNRPSNRVTLALSTVYTSDWDQGGRENLTIGGTTGLRGYDKLFKTGDRRFVLNAEARFFSGITFLSAMFGGVVFVDWGAIWRAGQPLDFGHTYASAGVGVRIALDKSTKNIVRIDLAYCEATQWELSIGTSQYFLATR